MKLSKIKSNPNNPRIIKDDKFKKLVQSIKEFPEMIEKRPMVCVTDIDGLIYPLGGNMRLKALKELNYKDIPDNWIVMADDWTEEKRKELFRYVKGIIYLFNNNLEKYSKQFEYNFPKDIAIKLEKIDMVCNISTLIIHITICTIGLKINKSLSVMRYKYADIDRKHGLIYSESKIWML